MEIRDRLKYDPKTGVVSWINSSCPRLKGKRQAGFKNKRGYVKIKIDNKSYFAHRIAWYLCYGSWPTLDIDHVNGNKDDNRIENLREATKSQNLSNSRLKTKYRGVSKANSKWRAVITHRGSKMHIGVYETKKEAYKAYVEKSRELNGEFSNV